VAVFEGSITLFGKNFNKIQKLVTPVSKGSMITKFINCFVVIVDTNEDLQGGD
jgi:hypothetical protein